MTGKLTSAFKAIADPTRREILHLLRKEEMTAGDVAARFDMTKPTMSHHFSVLRKPAWSPAGAKARPSGTR
jgi:ArsR family transcriptional regulator